MNILFDVLVSTLFNVYFGSQVQVDYNIHVQQ